MSDTTSTLTPGPGNDQAVPERTAVLAERQRLGQQLHDTTCQTLGGIQMLAAVVARRLRRGETVAPEQAEELCRLLRTASEELHEIVRGCGGPPSASLESAERDETETPSSLPA